MKRKRQSPTGPCGTLKHLFQETIPTPPTHLLNVPQRTNPTHRARPLHHHRPHPSTMTTHESPRNPAAIIANKGNRDNPLKQKSAGGVPPYLRRRALLQPHSEPWFASICDLYDIAWFALAPAPLNGQAVRIGMRPPSHCSVKLPPGNYVRPQRIVSTSYTFFSPTKMFPL